MNEENKVNEEQPKSQKVVLKLSGTAYSPAEYFFKKEHPIRWKFRRALKRLIRFIDGKTKFENYPKSYTGRKPRISPN